MIASDQPLSVRVIQKRGDFTLDVASGIAIDSTGAAYITGTAGSADFPTKNPIQGTRDAHSEDLFVTKLSPDGSSLVYSTYLSTFTGNGVGVDAAGNAYVGGNGYGGSSVTKLNSDGSAIVYSYSRIRKPIVIQITTPHG